MRAGGGAPGTSRAVASTMAFCGMRVSEVSSIGLTE
jgi:hypothetical protein